MTVGKKPKVDLKPLHDKRAELTARAERIDSGAAHDEIKRASLESHGPSLEKTNSMLADLVTERERIEKELVDIVAKIEAAMAGVADKVESDVANVASDIASDLSGKGA